MSFSLGGDLRFLSHQDTMRLFERAIIRAALPVAWSRGFNPRPRIALPLPRPVGTAGEDERLVLALETESAGGSQPTSPEQVLADLARQMPEGIRLTAVAAVGAMPQPASARYRVHLPPAQRPADLEERVEQLLAAGEAVVQRRLDAAGRTRPLDIRPYVLELRWCGDEGCLRMALAIRPDGAARCTEVLEALGLEADQLAHRIIREQVNWQPTTGPTQIDGPAGDAERKEN